MNKHINFHKVAAALSAVGIFLIVETAELIAQTSRAAVRPKTESDSYTIWYVALAVMITGLFAAVLWKIKSGKTEEKNAARKAVAKKSEAWDNNSLDADREMEWLRKNQILVDKKRKKNSANKSLGKSFENSKTVVETSAAASTNGQSDYLPVMNFEKIKPAAEFAPLPISNDEALLSAIEQAHDEYEEDEEVRDLSVRVLTAFKTRNSAEALSQIALYDLSSTVRSKAVATLTEFNHESVFESILLACADPTREVRAAAARGLTRLSFDRADAWARIMETNEKGRIRQAARAAIESGFVERAFDRLAHTDRQTAYEAFVLLAMLVKADETEPIFSALRNNKNIKVREAILHLLQVTKEQNALNELYNLLEDKSLTPDLKAKVDKVIDSIGLAVV